MLPRFILILTFSLLTLLPPAAALAQSSAPAIAPWMGEETQEILPQETQQPTALTQMPVVPEKNQASILEKTYSARIVDTVEQFGYDLFGIPREDTQRNLDHIAATPMGAVQEDFVLHSGDELEVVFSGQRTDRATYNVNSQGLLLIQDFPPIPAAGRTIGQVRLSIETAAVNLHNTQAYVSLSSVRQIDVLVVGHVRMPGRQTLTVFHTVLDALMEAGGIDKTGSLRQIKLVRDGRGTIIDLYGLLMLGSTHMDLRLRDGDRLIVPPLGPTVAIAGEVKRPGIYEILPEIKGMKHQPKNTSQKLSLNEMLEFGGGVLVPGQNRYLRLDVTPQGREDVQEIQEAFVPMFGDGSILMISKGLEKRSGMIELTGNTRREGLHALDHVPTLSALLDDEQALGKDIYPLIGVIERWNKDQLSNILIGFPLLLVLKGEYDQKLQEGDIIHLFSKKQIIALDQKNNSEDGAPIARKVAYGSGEVSDKEEKLDTAMRSFLRERSVFVRGAVRRPGAYPVAEGTTLDSALAVAGGLALEANTGNIEVTSAQMGEEGQAHGRSGTRRLKVDIRETNPRDVSIEAGDSVRVNQKFLKVEDQSVLIVGEVLTPGRYDLMPGDKISDLVRRAGGLNNQAYPEGAVFSRETERRAEESRFRAAARDMERAIAVAIEKEGKNVPGNDQISMARELAAELREVEALGRITIEASPGVLAVNPELDMLLEPGDRLYIPKRPLTVRVSGEVLSPASLQFRKEKAPVDYIAEAGGFTYHSDKERAFVLYPDGSAQPLQVSAWNHKATFIPPGSTIIVPRDPKPFDFIESAKDISQILSNLAISAIFIDDVRDDD